MRCARDAAEDVLNAPVAEVPHQRFGVRALHPHQEPVGFKTSRRGFVPAKFLLRWESERAATEALRRRRRDARLPAAKASTPAPERTRDRSGALEDDLPQGARQREPDRRRGDRARAREAQLVEALELTALYAKRDRPRFGRVAARWLQRWLDEASAPTLEDAAFVVGALCALGGRRHAEAMAVLFAATGP
jgi:hypothetical protein